MAFRSLAAIGLLFALPGLAAPLDLPVVNDTKITLKGMNAQVSYTVQPGVRQLKISGLEEAGWTWQKVGEHVYLMGPEADSRRGLQEQLKNPGRRAVIEITGASVPSEITLREGSVNLNRGEHDATVSLKNGKITAIGRGGSLNAHVMKGEIFVSDGRGRVVADAYQGQVNLRNLQQLDGEATLFSGQLVVENAKGTLSLNSTQATTRVQNFAGTLNVEHGKGSWTGTNLQGRVEGQTVEGILSLQLSGEADVNLRSQSGRITVQLPRASGASLNLLTREGDLSVPNELRVNRAAAEKTARGRLRGEAGKFSVTVRSQEGSVVVR